MSRTDIHAPGSPLFDPQAYDLVDVFDLHPESGDHRDLNKIVETLAAGGIKQARVSASRGCGHCGQTNVRYVALLVHRAAKEWIFTGQDCLVARFTDQTRTSFLQLKRDAELARAKQANKTAYLALCDANPALAYASYANNISAVLDDNTIRYAGLGWGLSTIADIARKARSYGEATDKQLALVERVVNELGEKLAAYEVKQAARAAEPTPEPLVEGRQVIEGVVLSLKEVDDNYSYTGGTITKVVVKLDGGQRVYGTLPSAIWNAERNDRIRFAAAVESSDDDPAFGFFKRPTRAEIVKEAVSA